MASRPNPPSPGFGDERTSRGWGEEALIAYPLQYIAFASVIAYRAFVMRQPVSLWGDMALLLALSAAELVRFTLARHGASRAAVRLTLSGILGTLVVAVGVRVAGFTWPQSGAAALALWPPLQFIGALLPGCRPLWGDEAWRFILGNAAWRSNLLVMQGIAALGLVRYFLAETTLRLASPLAFLYAWLFPGFLVSLLHGKSAGSTIRTGRRPPVVWPLVLWIGLIGALLIKGTDWRFVAAGVVCTFIGGFAAWRMDRAAAANLDERLRRRDQLDQGQGGPTGGTGSMA